MVQRPRAKLVQWAAPMENSFLSPSKYMYVCWTDTLPVAQSARPYVKENEILARMKKEEERSTSSSGGNQQQLDQMSYNGK